MTKSLRSLGPATLGLALLLARSAAGQTAPPTGSWHVVGYDHLVRTTVPPIRFENFLELFGLFLKGGTVAELRRNAGYCDGVAETIGRVSISKEGFTTNPDEDFVWETKVVQEPAQIREYYRRYLRRLPTCTELSTFVNDGVIAFPWDLAQIACTDEARQQGTYPNGFCNAISQYYANQLPSFIVSMAQTLQATAQCTVRNVEVPRIEVNKMGLALDQGGHFQRLKAAVGRPEDAADFAPSIKVFPTAKTFDWIIYLNALHANLSDYMKQICASTVSFTQRPHKRLTQEADATLRDFVDFQAQEPIGSNQVGNLFSGNAFNFFLKLAKSGGTFTGQNTGWFCYPGSACWIAVKSQFLHVING